MGLRGGGEEAARLSAFSSCFHHIATVVRREKGGNQDF